MNKENQEWEKAKRKALNQAIQRTKKELAHYKHLLRNNNHTWKECELRKS